MDPRFKRRWLVMLPAVVLASVAVACGGGSSAATPDRTTEPDPTTANGSTSNGGGEVREIVVSMQDNFFEPDEIRVKAGETVKIVATNDGVALHNMIVSTADVAGQDFQSDPLVNPGEESSFEMTIPTAGSYQFFCAFHMPGMVGTVIVE